MHYEFYNADDVELKMLVRANPGIVLVKDGVIMGKWSAYNVPSVNDMYKILLKQPAKTKK
jgi:hypothetical protein